MWRNVLILAGLAGIGAIGVAAPSGRAQRDVQVIDPATAQAELQRATSARKRAGARAERLAAEAESATDAAEKAARQAAAIAAEIQQAEADITVARARYSLAQSQRRRLSRRLAERQQPVVRLTSALQATARRPLVLSALQPGSLKDVVHVRAVLDNTVPEIQRRTAGLRSDLERRRQLERNAERSLAALRQSQEDLEARRQALTRLEARQRLASRDARRSAARESERALALAEEARDLDGLVETLARDAGLRRELAALPGPIMRPSGLTKPSVSARDIGSAGAGTGAATDADRPTSARPPSDFQLPVQGRTIAGFGTARASGLRRNGVTIRPRSGAQIVAPASGRVAFAGAYRGFGEIVIIEHAGGWTSLVTGLDRAKVVIGEQVIGGSPLGRAPTGGASYQSVTFELRRGGTPVNPLEFIR